jgi:hypothetical protein
MRHRVFATWNAAFQVGATNKRKWQNGVIKLHQMSDALAARWWIKVHMLRIHKVSFLRAHTQAEESDAPLVKSGRLIEHKFASKRRKYLLIVIIQLFYWTMENIQHNIGVINQPMSKTVIAYITKLLSMPTATFVSSGKSSSAREQFWDVSNALVLDNVREVNALMTSTRRYKCLRCVHTSH